MVGGLLQVANFGAGAISLDNRNRRSLSVAKGCATPPPTSFATIIGDAWNRQWSTIPPRPGRTTSSSPAWKACIDAVHTAGVMFIQLAHEGATREENVKKSGVRSGKRFACAHASPQS